ncbi:HupE/UreJ family protein [Pseudomonas sp. HK3]
MKKIFAALLLNLPMLVMAHPGHESISATQGLIAGALHPLMGIDHLLAFAALGILLFRLKAKQAMLIGSAFVVLLAVGFYGAQMGALQLASATVESLILLSVVLSIACLGLGRFVGHYKSALLVTAFAIFHGVAHGVEVPAGASSHGFAAGFLFSTCAVLLLVRKGTSFVSALSCKQPHTL